MSSPPWLLLVLHPGDYAPTAVQMDVLWRVLIAAAPLCCERHPSVAVSICLEL